MTALFCDLIDSTTLIDDLDPEISRGIIRDFQMLGKDVIEDFGGRVMTYLGDGIVALFSHYESNAGRAINTALQIIRKIDRAEGNINQSKHNIGVRCGIATGLAVVGDDMLGHSHIRLETAIGMPVNLAGRIQSLAQAGGIMIDRKTHVLTQDQFEFKDIGQHALKGIKNPQQVWRVVAEKSIASRFVAHAAELTPMVGRTKILQQLMNYWERSLCGDPQAVILLGEAGVGKSRINQELIDIISIDHQYQNIEFICSPHHSDTALHPISCKLKIAAGLNEGDSLGVQLRKLEILLQQSTSNMEHDLSAYANLASLPVEGKWSLTGLDADERKERVFSALISNILSLSESNPLLLTIEDAHWIDHTTLELLTRLINALAGHSVLLVITSRPGFNAERLLAKPDVKLVEIERMPEKYAMQMAARVRGNGHLSSVTLDKIVQRAEGIPLYIEELSKSLMERTSPEELLNKTGVVGQITLPETLQELLQSRLDCLPEASKSVARLAAVIGRDFSHALLAKVMHLDEKSLNPLLAPLLEAQLVVQRKAPPNAEYSFKHALIRDVAYETLLNDDRVAIYKSVAESIEILHPERSETCP